MPGVVLGFNDEALSADVQGRRDAAMHERLGQVDLGAEDLESAIRANESDELDESSTGQGGGRLEVIVRKTRLEAEGALELVRRRALEHGIAMMGVVEALEVSSTLGRWTVT